MRLGGGYIREAYIYIHFRNFTVFVDNPDCISESGNIISDGNSKFRA